MIAFILQNIVAIGLLSFLIIGLAISWKIKPMRYSLIVSIFLVLMVIFAVGYGGLKIEKIIAKSGYLALFVVWFAVLVVFVVGMYRLWKNIGDNN